MGRIFDDDDIRSMEFLEVDPDDDTYEGQSEAVWRWKEGNRQSHLLRLMETVEADRKALHESTRRFLSYINNTPGLKRQWDRFIESGGATAADLRRQLNGVTRPTKRKVPARGLVRLVVVNEPKPIRARFKPGTKPIPDDAA